MEIQIGRVEKTDLMTSAEVSVIMPVYNAEKYIKAAVESILDQTFSNFEFLVFDDASTDGSLDILRSFSDDRINLHTSKENLGYLSHLNHGLRIAQGKYIARMDADDIAAKERLEQQWSFMEANPKVGLLGSSFVKFGAVQRTVNLPTTHDELKLRLLHINPFCHSTIMLRTQLLKEHELSYPAAYYTTEDYWLWSRISEVSTIASLPEILLQYRVHEKSISEVRKDYQRNLAKSIQNENLIRFLKLSDDELQPEVYQKMIWGESFTQKEIILLGQWLAQLIKINDHMRGIDPNLFQDFIIKKWKQVIFSNIDTLPSISVLNSLSLAECLSVKDSMKIRFSRFRNRFLL